MSTAAQNISPPKVRLIGEIDHPDFRDAVALLRADGPCELSEVQPELIVAAQARPGVISARTIEMLRKDFPLSGLVALLGSWCEGEARTGRPWPGVQRLYWYEFPAWWRRQLMLRRAGCCPDWARGGDCGLRIADCGLENGRNSASGGLVLLHTRSRESASAMADALVRGGYATVWDAPGRPAPVIRGAVAGIWDGGQLHDAEVPELAAFCRRMRSQGAAVVALLDFPRRDRVDRAVALGAAAVLGKPWWNSELVSSMASAISLGGVAEASRAA